MDSVGLKGIAARQPGFRGLPWETLIHTLPIGIYTCDQAGRLVQHNSQAAEL
jgi:PAS domain-containing protein